MATMPALWMQYEAVLFVAGVQGRRGDIGNNAEVLLENDHLAGWRRKEPPVLSKIHPKSEFQYHSCLPLPTSTPFC